VQVNLLLLPPAVRLVAAQLGWQVVPPGSADSQWDLFWTDTSISHERLLRLAPTQVRTQQQQLHCQHSHQHQQQQLLAGFVLYAGPMRHLSRATVLAVRAQDTRV
jgi:hypothetical protein